MKFTNPEKIMGKKAKKSSAGPFFWTLVIIGGLVWFANSGADGTKPRDGTVEKPREVTTAVEQPDPYERLRTEVRTMNESVKRTLQDLRICIRSPEYRIDYGSEREDKALLEILTDASVNLIMADVKRASEAKLLEVRGILVETAQVHFKNPSFVTLFDRCESVGRRIIAPQFNIRQGVQDELTRSSRAELRRQLDDAVMKRQALYDFKDPAVKVPDREYLGTAITDPEGAIPVELGSRTVYVHRDTADPKFKQLQEEGKQIQINLVECVKSRKYRRTVDRKTAEAMSEVVEVAWGLHTVTVDTILGLEKAKRKLLESEIVATCNDLGFQIE